MRQLVLALGALPGRAFLSCQVQRQTHRGRMFGAFGDVFHGVHGAALRSTDYPHTEFVLEGQAIVRLVFHVQGGVTALDAVPLLIPLDFIQQFQSVVAEYNRTDGGLLTLVHAEEQPTETGHVQAPKGKE